MKMKLQSKLSNKLIFIALYLIYFCDLFSFSLVIVIFAQLLIPKANLLLPANISTEERNIITGLLLATYPAAQLISAPLLGSLSDYLGRKRILLISTLINAIGFIWSAIAIITNNIHLLFISRLVAGFSAGNATLSQATVADLTEVQKRGKYMAIFPITGGLAWISAPYLAGILSDPNIIHWFNYATPFWLVAILFFACFILIYLIFTENKPLRSISAKNYLDTGSLTQYKKRKILLPIILLFLIFLGWFFFISYFSTYLLEQFDFNDIRIDSTFAYLSVWYMLGGFCCNLWLLKKHSAERTAIIPLFLFAFSLFSIALIQQAHYFNISLIFAGACQAIAVTCLYTICSKLAGEDLQGKVFGIINALIALCFIISPPISGWLANYQLNLPLKIGSAILFLSACIYSLRYWKLAKN